MPTGAKSTPAENVEKVAAERGAAPPGEVVAGNVYTALAAVQAEIPEVTKGRTAVVKGVTKDGRPFEYTYTYADLAAVTDAILPLLGKNGLAWVTMPTMTSAGMALKYELVHGASGSKIDGVLPIAGSDPQALAGQITYYRRYALCAVTGVAADEDDDGARASAHVREERAHQRRGDQRNGQEPNRNQPRSQTRQERQDPPAAAIDAKQLDQLAIRLVEGPLPSLVENWRGAHGLGVLNAKPTMEVIERFRAPYVGEEDPDVTDFLPGVNHTLRDLVVWRLSEEARASLCKPDIRQLYEIARELEQLNLGPAQLTPDYTLAGYLADRARELPEERPAPDPWLASGQTFEQWAREHPDDPRASAAASWKPSGEPVDPPWDTDEPPMTPEQRAKVDEVAADLKREQYEDQITRAPDHA